MEGEDLARLLCRLEAGMSLTVPDQWLEEVFPGSRLMRMQRVNEMAGRYHCLCHDGLGAQTFEKPAHPWRTC
ncbi:hypothetical protein MWN34_13025 [Ancylobacter sp. 6x-1]|uniref:Uncharacterized protein n=1 Tax=Ancylobacter crimeensis TaxID=2579147 RepID=A0ABT0DCY9_9HYPH|nr:hypothetical protein [Ancylobacter crimeensis]MCK0197831.1 hypothetical protein [Ancylobacter crimeensis]